MLEKRGRILGEEHPDTLIAMHNLASAYHALGNLAKALELAEETFRKSQNILGKRHPFTIKVAKHLSVLYRELGRVHEASPLERGLHELENRDSDLEIKS